MLTKQIQHIILIFILPLSIFILFSSFNYQTEKIFTSGGHNSFNMHLDSVLFIPGKACEGCHGRDIDGLASVDESGTDVNVYDDWKASMMGMAAMDPFWRAKVSHEGILYPAAKEVIEDKCTTCHAPMGNFTKKLNGSGLYSLGEAMNDSLGLDGVSCLVCHMQPPEGFGNHFSGAIIFNQEKKVYGPYANPFDGPMKEFVGYNPVFGEHIQSSEGCAACHTLITEALNPDGSFSGKHFVEQATYHEWLNSKYAVTGVTCLTCHLPQTEDKVVIASNYSFLEGRSPFGIHTFNGANAFMLKMLRDNSDTLEIEIADSLFDQSISNTDFLLQHKSVEMEVIETSMRNDSVFTKVKLTNITGHKFPSGYPSRRAFLSLIATNTDGDTVFHSGKWDEVFRIPLSNLNYEPHHELISDDSLTQIYELVPGDVDNNFTTALLAATSPLKDNRLVPIGFSSAHSVYDTTLIAGLAVNDDNFNFVLGEEGSGTDEVTYAINISEPTQNLNLQISLWYQSISPRWLDNLFSYENDSIIAGFRHLYQTSDNTPILVGTVSDTFYITDVSQNQSSLNVIKIFPNPVQAGQLCYLSTNLDIDKVSFFDIHGKEIGKSQLGSRPVFIAPPKSGIYFLKFRSNGSVYTSKLLVL
jgi:hypothetical protein